MKLKKLQNIMEAKNVDALLIAYEWNVFYFTEVPRPSGSYLMLVKGLEPKMLVPALDYWRVSVRVKNTVEVIPYSTYEIPSIETKPITKELSSWIASRLKSHEVQRVGIDLSYITKLGIKVKERLKDVKVIDIGEDISRIRMIKENEEILLMRKALDITEKSLTKVLNNLKPKIREYEVAGLLEGSMRLLGADGYAFETIVASGPNGAFPHALPTDKEILAGEEVVIDMGARFGGYCADMTRTPVVGKGSADFKAVIEILDEAVKEATDVVSPGIRASEVDGVARKVLEKYGYSKYFIHSLGHGVGVEVHEPPRIAQGIDTQLMPGMIITIEPGIYVNGKFGARIENMVMVTKTGHETLNKLPNII